MKQKLKFGIVGMGLIGTRHAAMLRDGHVPGATLSAICDRSSAGIPGYEHLPRYTDVSSFLEEHRMDAVLIATPHYSHTPLGIQALEAGYHVLMEKPLSVTKQECEILLRTRRNPGQRFGLMLNQRANPAHRKLKSLLESGELGNISRFAWNITDWFRTQAYYNAVAWRGTWRGEGGGVLVNQSTHQLDLLQWFFGMPVRVYAECGFGKTHDLEVEDEVHALLTFENGMVGSFTTSTGEAPGVNRLEIACERGLVTLEADALRWTRNESASREWIASSADHKEKPPSREIVPPLSPREGEGHREILRNFTNAVLQGTPLIAPASEGIHAVELANAMLYSGMRNTPVRLSADSRLYTELYAELHGSAPME